MEGVRKAGVLVGARKQLNFIEGTNTTITISDSGTVANCIDITLAASGATAAPSDADYLVGTANGTLSGEIVVGTTPGGELGNTWASPTVDASHSGSTHAATQAAAEATAAAANTTDIATHAGLADPHAGYRLESADHTHATTGLQAGQLTDAALSGTPGGELGNTWQSPTIDATHSGSTHAGAASAAVTTHEGLADPHTGYRLESADHTHATTGLQAGTIAHSVTTGITATDHHVAPAAGPDANVTVDVAGAAGTASTFARSGHGHQVVTSSSAAGAVGTAAAGSSGTAPSRGDHVHPTGAGTPVTQAFGDAAAIGAGPAAAMTNHVHGMPAATVTRTLWVPGNLLIAGLDTGTSTPIGTAPDILGAVALADAATQGFHFTIATPNDWSSGAITYTIYWSPGSTDAVAHTIRWSTDVLKHVTGTTLVNAAGTTTAFTGTSLARTVNVLYAELAQTLYTPTTAGELGRVDIRRVGADAADTYVGVVRVHGVLLSYTATR